MHKLLQRQLRRARAERADEELDIETLLALVDAAYGEADRERRFMAHAYEAMREEQATLVARQMRTHDLMAQIRAEKAEADRARAVAEAELLKKERLSVLGQLTATVAHELRNPLSSIRISCQAIRDTALREGTSTRAAIDPHRAQHPPLRRHHCRPARLCAHAHARSRRAAARCVARRNPRRAEAAGRHRA